MDKVFFFESLLSDERQNDLQNKFSNLLPDSKEGLEYSLVFRQGGLIGANAFALPDGTIVMTDELVELAHYDDEIVSILLHEIGHIVHRHSLRQIISHSGLAVLTVMMTGDVVSAGTLMLSLPNILMKSSFSREHETEADEYSRKEMLRLGIKTDHFANIMYRLELEYIELEEGEEELDFDTEWLEYFSSHPATDDRMALFRTVNTPQVSNELLSPYLLKDVETYRNVDIFDLRAMFEQGDYEKLEELLDSHQRSYENGLGSEITTELAYEYLAFSDPDYETRFDAWIQARPGTYIPYLARATYYYNLAHTKSASYQKDDSSEKIAADIEHTRGKAIADAKKALQIRSNLTLAYSLLVAIADLQNDPKLRQKYLNEALELNPSSYILRRDALYFLSPEEGGSYAKISRFLVDTKKQISKNSDLESLLGYLYYVKSWDAYSNRKYKRTIRLTTLALNNRNNASFYQQRANAYYSLEAYEFALIDYTNAIKLYAYDPGLYVWRAYTYIELDQEDMALKDLRHAARLFPYHRGVLIKLGNVAHNQGQFTEAEQAYNTALVYSPDNPYLYYSIGRNLLFGEGNVEAALPSLKKAIDMNPDAANYWYAYGVALHDYGDCNAVSALEKHLEICDEGEDYDCEEDTRKWAENTISQLKQGQCSL